VPKTVTVPFEGRPEPAVEVDFQTLVEPWAEYRLGDGAVLRLKTVLGAVVKLTERTKENGEPIYIINAAPVVIAKSADGGSTAEN
jgi:hypothetical protein